MAFPSPTDAPDAFLRHLTASNLEFGSTTFQLYLARPLPQSGRLDEASAQQWCEKMDSSFGKLSRLIKTCPESADVHTALSDVCTAAAGEVEAALAAQRQADRDEEQRIEKEKKEAAEREEKERLERESEIEKGRKEIEAAERELEEKKRVLLEVQKMSKDTQGAEESMDVEKDDNPTKQELQRHKQWEARSRLIQIKHPVLCQLCVQRQEVVCSGPKGHACDVCWKTKRSCENGGRRITVKEEPKSPAQPARRKRKAYSTIDSSAIGSIEGPINVDFTPPVGKRAKVASGSGSTFQFDGVEVARPATRRSTRTAKSDTKKDMAELFKRLGKEFEAISKTCEEIAEAAN